MSQQGKYSGLEIAIIGMSAQFPGCSDYREFWKKLQEGTELIKEFSDEELIASGVSPHELTNEQFVKRVGVLENKHFFDHSFFGYTPEEASLMDPQVRLFHEHCWKALEDSGYSNATDNNRIGLYAGASENDNWRMYAYSRMNGSSVDPFIGSRISDKSFMSSLVSYKLNLKGPSLVVNTGCSTSLVAVNLACKALLTRECTIALAGGVCLGSGVKKGYYYQEGAVSSRDGHCRAFDSEASGTSIGEGIGVVVMKRLSEAIKDGDHIFAVIKASYVNNDGTGKVGYVAPGINGQADCIRTAIRMAGVDPNNISYVEAHGTGTRLGDPIEIEALNQAFATGNKSKYCAVGSVKTNMGHLDGAAGIAGLIKTALCLKYKKIVPSLHFKTANPEINFEGGPFYVNTVLKEWEKNNSHSRLAGVSSFGIGGTNAHVILEESPDEPDPVDESRYKLFTLSAKTPASLAGYAKSFGEWLAASNSNGLSDMSYTLQACRKHFNYRKHFVYGNREELINALLQMNNPTKSQEKNGSVVFMFSGAGSQYRNMGKELYDSVPFFREEMDKGFELLKKITGEDYKNILYSPVNSDNRVNEMLHTQPLIFLFGYSLSRLMISLNIQPAYLIGHSIGEYVAACIAGVFSFEDALKLTVRRGQLMNTMPQGVMLSLYMGAQEAERFLSEKISLAAVNGSQQVVLSGETNAMEELILQLQSEEISFIKLYASHAGHSPTIDMIMEEFRKELETVSIHSPRIPVFTNLTGQSTTHTDITKTDYWVNQMRNTVRFSEGIKNISAIAGKKIWIEIGGGHSLATLLKQYHQHEDVSVVNMIRHPKEEVSDVFHFADRTGLLWSYGLTINWTEYYNGRLLKKISMPSYPFEQIKYPAEVDPFRDSSLFSAGFLPAAHNNHSLKDWVYFPSWKKVPNIINCKIETERTFLFFSLENEISEHIKSGLSLTAKKIIEIKTGDVYEQQDNLFVVDSGKVEHIERLIKDLHAKQIAITDVIYSWAMGVNESRIELKENNPALNRSYFCFTKLASELLKRDEQGPKRFYVLTDSLFEITGKENCTASQSLLLGPVNIIPQESSSVSIHLDIDLKERPEELVQQLLQEFGRADKTERTIGLRNGYRWIRHYERNTEDLAKSGIIREKGTYLITGGLGNVGFILSKHLLENYNANVLIIGRTMPGNDSECATFRKLNELKKISENVSYYCADVCDHDDLKNCISSIDASGMHINGVIHTAANVDQNNFETLEEISYARSINVFAPKVNGLKNIYSLFGQRQLDFVWLTSSIASVLGGVAYCAYSSANAYMDYFVSSKARELTHWKSVNLGEMLFTHEQAKREDMNMSRSSLKPSEICELFEWSLGAGTNVVIETAIDLQERIYQTYVSDKNTIISGVFDPESISASERPGLSTEYHEPVTETEKKLVILISNFFGITGIGIHDNFFELGGDSLKAMVVSKRIKKDFGVGITIKEFFMNPTVHKISIIIDETLFLVQKKERASKTII